MNSKISWLFYQWCLIYAVPYVEKSLGWSNFRWGLVEPGPCEFEQLLILDIAWHGWMLATHRNWCNAWIVTCHASIAWLEKNFGWLTGIQSMIMASSFLHFLWNKKEKEWLTIVVIIILFYHYKKLHYYSQHNHKLQLSFADRFKIAATQFQNFHIEIFASCKPWFDHLFDVVWLIQHNAVNDPSSEEESERTLGHVHGGQVAFCCFFASICFPKLMRTIPLTSFALQVPAHAGGSALPDSRISLQCRVSTVLLPLHHPQGTGRLLPPHPCHPRRPLHRHHDRRSCLPDQPGCGPWQRTLHHSSGTVVLPDCLHPLRPHDAPGLPPRWQRNQVPPPRERGPRGAASQLPTLLPRLSELPVCTWMLRHRGVAVRPPRFEEIACVCSVRPRRWSEWWGRGYRSVLSRDGGCSVTRFVDTLLELLFFFSSSIMGSCR